jgi:hypothetical protein
LALSGLIRFDPPLSDLIDQGAVKVMASEKSRWLKVTIEVTRGLSRTIRTKT